MTTITYRDGIVAADSQLSTGGGWASPFPANKLERHGDAIVGLCGDWAAVRVLRDWYLRGAHDTTQPEAADCTLCVIKPDQILTFSMGAMLVEEGPLVSWGSGAPVAMAAMLAGASAEFAVKIACSIDPWSAEPVVTMRRTPPT